MSKLYKIAIAVLLALNIFLLIKLKTNIKEIDQNPYDSKLLGNTEEILFNNLYLQLIGEEDTLDKKLLLYTGDNLQLPLEKILSNERKIIFRFSDRQCPACIDAQLIKIKQFEKLFKKDDILIIASGDKREILIKISDYKLKCPIYFTDFDGFKIDIEKYNVPFYFITDRNCIANLVFIPAKEIPLATDNYFSILKKRFFKNN